MDTMHLRRAVTAEQLLQLHEPGHRFELVRGEVRRMSNAGWWHGLVAMRLAARMQQHADQHALGAVFAAETGFLLERSPDTVRSPDIAFVRRDRLPHEPGRGHFQGAADLAVEVLSPGDSRADALAKATTWLAAGARLVWVIAPEDLRVWVHRHATVDERTTSDLLHGDEVLPGFAVPIADLLQPPR